VGTEYHRTRQAQRREALVDDHQVAAARKVVPPSPSTRS
jgi:hypothetical protein